MGDLLFRRSVVVTFCFSIGGCQVRSPFEEGGKPLDLGVSTSERVSKIPKFRSLPDPASDWFAPSHHRGIHVAKNFDGSIHLRGRDCNEVTNQAGMMLSWAESKGLTDLSLGAVIQENGFCRQDVSYLLPRPYRQSIWSYPVYFKVNCWKASLFDLSISDGLNNIASQPFFEFVAKSSQCRRVTGKKKVFQAGTLVSVLERDIVRDADGNLVDTGYKAFHSATFLTNRLVFTKNGEARTVPVRIMDFDEMISEFMGGEDIRCASTSLGDTDREGCEKVAEYYRCQSNEEFIGRNRDLVPKKLQEILKVYAEFEREVGEENFSQYSWNNQFADLDLLESQGHAIPASVRGEKRVPAPEPDRNLELFNRSVKEVSRVMSDLSDIRSITNPPSLHLMGALDRRTQLSTND